MKYIATLNGKKYEVEVEKVGGGYKSLSRGSSAPVAPAPAAAPVAAPAPAPAAAPAAEKKTKKTKASAGGTTIVSPMPGSIFDLKVSEGDSVKFGQVVIVLEAMKMENEIVAPVDGKVVSISVKKGDTVDTDQVLITLE